MSLNPVQFGKEVIDQYARHLLTTFSFADEDLMKQLREGLAHPPGREERLAKGPYVYLNRPFVQGPGMNELVHELSLHDAMPGIFKFDSLHKHQELCLRAVLENRNVLLATGTGSGKTEAFLLPILQHCLELRDSGASAGIVALLIYPMNALVNDQLERLRYLLAGSRVTFGRYTGETPESGENQDQLDSPRRYTVEELEKAASGKLSLPAPWEECTTRSSIRSRLPRILLTNYAQLEYLLLRDKDLGLFRDAPLKYFVMDEIHTYSGSLGSEVACLLRRLRTVCNKESSEVVYIGTSATVTDRAGGASVEEATVKFAASLFGVEEGTVALIKEQYQRPVSDYSEFYTPAFPDDVLHLLSEILDSVKSIMVAEEIEVLPESLLKLAEKLCGKSLPFDGNSLEALHSVLSNNRIVKTLYECFCEPSLYTDAEVSIQGLQGRESRSDSEVQAEMLCYLLLGALARKGDEPLLRPKLHYFVQGLEGVWLTFDESGKRILHFAEDNESFGLPVMQCRVCGQHYYLLAASQRMASDLGGELYSYREVKPIDGLWLEVESGSDRLLLTDCLIGQEEEDIPCDSVYLCRHCGTLHDKPSDCCQMPTCKAEDELMPLLSWNYEELHRCPSCSGSITQNNTVIIPLRSSEVNDVMVLAQTMLSAMKEEELRKVLIFSDSRQEAAFQAGWMAKRALRFRLRHLLYGILNEHPHRKFYFQTLLEELVNKAVDEGLMPARGSMFHHWRDKLSWMMLEEFFAVVPGQRRSSLEQLGLAHLDYEGLDPGSLDEFSEKWCDQLNLSAEEYSALVSLILDIFRLYHAVSHEMLRHEWSYRDKEYRSGVVNPPEYYKPQVIMPNSVSGRGKSYAKGFRASNGRSSVQVLVRKGVPGVDEDARAKFIDELWEWLCDSGYLKKVSITQRGYNGRPQTIAGLGDGLQVNIDLIRVSSAGSVYRCKRCHSSRGYQLPTAVCPKYHCDGEVELRDADQENYDVFQYTRMDFVPLHPREHSAQVPKNDRKHSEDEFKKTGGEVNCIVATPTLELGVDIGKLEMVMMRNVPPSPANYAQRGGRAGRKHRIGAVFTYCRKRKHDNYFYAKPPEMISGSVRIPSFSMQNSPLVRKHVYSMILTELRRICGDDQSVLDEAFPTYIKAYLEKESESGRVVVRDEVLDFSGLRDLIREHRQELLDCLERTFLLNWPQEFSGVVSKPELRRMLNDLPNDLETVAEELLIELKTYRRIIRDIEEKEHRGEWLTKEDELRIKNYRDAQKALRSTGLENITLSYLARKGLLPGYSLFRDSVTAVCLNPILDVSRNVQQALREFTPANLIYANGNEFIVNRLDFYKLKAKDPDFTTDKIISEMKLESNTERLVDFAQAGSVGGTADWTDVSSLQLVDVKLDGSGEINDQKDHRLRVAFVEKVISLNRHQKGHFGTVGALDYRFLREEWLRLVNLGPKRIGPAAPLGKPFSGFPICPVCGGVRSPFASEDEIGDFINQHRERCGVEPDWYALHSEIKSDTIRFGPFLEDGLAVNVIEAVLLGAGEVLELNDQELEYNICRDENGLETCLVYDPAPGGSGFLDLLIEFWEDIVDMAIDMLSTCECETACYGCLLSYTNQRYHEVLDKNRAIEYFRENRRGFIRAGEIPACIASSEEHLSGQESDAEEELLEELKEHGFPPPSDSQYRIELGGSSYTVADYAYQKNKIAIFIDGLSKQVHGNAASKVKDTRIRTMLNAQGWSTLSISARGIRDPELLNSFLEKLKTLLN